jgi:hypothetical protein
MILASDGKKSMIETISFDTRGLIMPGHLIIPMVGLAALFPGPLGWPRRDRACIRAGRFLNSYSPAISKPAARLETTVLSSRDWNLEPWEPIAGSHAHAQRWRYGHGRWQVHERNPGLAIGSWLQGLGEHE